MLTRYSLTLTAVMAVGAGISITYQPHATAQSPLEKLLTAVGNAHTVHVRSWTSVALIPGLASHTKKQWLEGDAWATANAVRISTEPSWNYLWTPDGTWEFDQTTHQVSRSPGVQARFVQERRGCFDPIQEVKQSLPPGMKMTLSDMGEETQEGQRIQKLRIVFVPLENNDQPEGLPLKQRPKISNQPTPTSGSADMQRRTFWIQKTSSLPVYQEQEKYVHGQWVLAVKWKYEYGVTPSLSVFTPAALQKTGDRQILSWTQALVSRDPGEPAHKFGAENMQVKPASPGGR